MSVERTRPSFLLRRPTELSDHNRRICFSGDGSYSSVYKVKRQEDSQIYALKKVKIQNLSDREKENALNEVRILASIKNSFVAAYKQAFFDEPTNSLW